MTQKIQDLEKQLEEKTEEVVLLERKIALIQGGAIEGMVSRAQVGLFQCTHKRPNNN